MTRSVLPDEQAEPLDTATPARSSPITSASASTPGKQMLVVFGTRSLDWPLTNDPSCSRRTRRSKSRSCAMRAPSKAARQLRGHAESHGGNALHPRAAPPLLRSAGQQGNSVVPARTQSAPAPLGPCILCADNDSESAESAATSIGTSSAPDGVAMHVDATLAAVAADLGDGLDDAGLVVRQHHRYQSRLRTDRGDHLGGVHAAIRPQPTKVASMPCAPSAARAPATKGARWLL